MHDREKPMLPQIIDRGRGPELEGTRVTVYRIMDFLRDGVPERVIAEELELTDAQVQVALDYIDSRRDEVEAEYQRILVRSSQGNPTWVATENALSADELRRRI